MEKIRLGKTDLMVTLLGFGGIPIRRMSNEDAAIAVVRGCLDLGINFIDTANDYFTSEERIGKAIAGRREGLILATKTKSRAREGVESHLKLSLKRLQTEFIDLYQFHGVDSFRDLDSILAPDGPLAALQEAKEMGLIKHIGISSHSLDIAIEAVKTDLFETVMYPLNITATEAVDELLPLAREHDVGYIVMKPLAGGRLDDVNLAFKYLFQFPDIFPIVGIGKVSEMEEILQLYQETR